MINNLRAKIVNFKEKKVCLITAVHLWYHVRGIWPYCNRWRWEKKEVSKQSTRDICHAQGACFKDSLQRKKIIIGAPMFFLLFFLFFYLFHTHTHTHTHTHKTNNLLTGKTYLNIYSKTVYIASHTEKKIKALKFKGCLLQGCCEKAVKDLLV